MNAITKIRNLLATKVGNPIAILLIGFLDGALLAAYGQKLAKAQYFWQIAGRNVLDFAPLLQDFTDSTGTPIDDAFVEELCQAASEICPNYQPAVWPG